MPGLDELNNRLLQRQTKAPNTLSIDEKMKAKKAQQQQPRFL
jgi:hypothetical protein